jgi:serine/threonine protein kinase
MSSIITHPGDGGVLPGLDLYEVITITHDRNNTATISPAVIRTWCAQLLDIADRHAQEGVVSRSMGLENVIVDTHCNIRSVVSLEDVGLPVLHGASDGEITLPQEQILIGAGAHYYPPEYLSSGTVSIAKADLWGVGVLLWEVAVNDNPWGLQPESDPPEVVLQAVVGTTADYITNHANLDPELFDMLKVLIAPLESRASAAQAKSMPYFAGINWERAALFPQDQPRPELAQIAATMSMHPYPSTADQPPPPRLPRRPPA